MTIAILILAAGQSARMRGADKLMQDVGGNPALHHIISEALASGLPVWVTVPAADHPRADVIPKGAIPVPVPDARDGMAASIRTGVAALPDTCMAVMIVPADMPDLTSHDFAELARQFYPDVAPIVRATTQDGQPGHPVLFPRDLFKALKRLSGDNGAASVLQAEKDRVQTVSLMGDRAILDLDTPEDWADWRARNNDDGSA